MSTFINVRKFADGRVTINPPATSLEEMKAIGELVKEKILSICEIDNANLMPLTGRQVYLNDLEVQGLKAAGLLIGTDKVKKIFGYQIIVDEDLSG